MEQLDEGIDEVDGIQPINLGLPIMKELEAKWLEEMFDHISDNPQIISLVFFPQPSLMLWMDEIEK